MSASAGRRRCRCGAELGPASAEPVPLERVTCPGCGAERLLSSFEKMDVALSERCNYRCQMCRRPPEAADLGRDEVIDVLEQAREIGLGTVSFCGGEPFVHEGFVEIARRAIDLGFQVQLTTNGSLVTEERIEALAGLDCLTVSIDGLEETHDRIRGVRGAFQRALGALRLAGEAGITCGTNTVIQRDNASELLPLFERLLEATGGRIDYVRHAPVEVTPEIVDLMVPDEAVAAVRRQLERIAAICDEREIYFSHREQLLHHLPLFLDKWTRSQPLGGCRIPQKFIGYSHLGFYLCWHQGKSLRAASLVEALSTEVARQIVADALAGRCVGCNALTYSWDEEWNAAILAGKRVRDGSVVDGLTTISGEWSEARRGK